MLNDEILNTDLEGDLGVDDRDTDSSYAPSAECASSSESEDEFALTKTSSKSKVSARDRGSMNSATRQFTRVTIHETESYSSNSGFQNDEQPHSHEQQSASDYEVEIAEFPKIISVRGNCHTLFEREKQPAFEVPQILSMATDKILRLYSKWGPIEGNFVCNICDKVFKQEAKVKRHMRTHLNFKEFECPICGKYFRRKCQLTVHKRTHSEEKPHACETCGHRFRERGALKNHRKLHVEEKRHACEICDRKFSTRKIQERHLMGHIKAKPFTCKHCDKKFTRKWTLDDHLKRHFSGTKDHVCYLCGKAFSRNTQLTNHMVVHTRKPEHFCDICDIQFQWRGSLYKHMRRTHSMTWSQGEITESWSELSTTGRRCQITVDEQEEESLNIEHNGDVIAIGMTSPDSGLDQSV